MNEFSEDQRFGSSRFAVDAETLPLRREQEKGKPRLYHGVNERGEIYRHPSDAPALMVAGSGAGKAVSGGILYNACTYPGSMLITDFKGEIASVSMVAQTFMHKHAYCVNFLGSLGGLPSHFTDPLDILTPDSKTLVLDAKMISEMLVPFTGSKEGQYFQEKARLLIEAILLADMEGSDG